ncbi:MAG: DUF3854 domain-containing protein, partial [Terriglobales bacterium]
MRGALGQHGYAGCDLAGLLIPLRSPRSPGPLGDWARLAKPPTGCGKYLAPKGSRWLYMPPLPVEWLDDPAVVAVVVEGPKSALALLALAQRCGRRLAPIACGGCWGWRRNDGFRDSPSGGHESVTAPSPSLDWLAWPGREAIVALDGDTRSNPSVAAALRALACQLAGRGASVRIAAIPAEAGEKAGLDDVIEHCGDGTMLAVLDTAKPWAQCALAAAEGAVSAIEAKDSAARKTAPLPTVEIADVPDPALRARLIGRVAALKIPGVVKPDLENQIARHRAEADAARQGAAEAARRGKLMRIALDPAVLVADLEGYFSGRAHAPEGAPVVLSLWALLTYALDPFSTAPYLCLESALPDCGKSTVLDLLEAVCARAEQCSGLTRAVLVRTIEANHTTILLDQGEWLRDKKDESGLMGVLLSGYRRGKPYRCVEGDSHELASFDTFGLKAFCAVRGLSGPLATRCVVIHMERMPAGVELESAEAEDLAPVVGPLKERCEAFALQSNDALRRLVADRPRGGYWPQFSNRERQLWTPLLTIARLCGPEIELRAVAAAELLAGRKAEAAADDPRAAKAIALLDVLGAVTTEKFSPGGLVSALAETEAWGEALAEKLRLDDTGKAAANLVGHFLRGFRLSSRERQRSGSLYVTAEARKKLRQHLPVQRTPEELEELRKRVLGPYPQKSATSATSATDQRHSPGLEVADLEKTETRSATRQPRSATAPSGPPLVNGNAVADANSFIADAEQALGRSATPG